MNVAAKGARVNESVNASGTMLDQKSIESPLLGSTRQAIVSNNIDFF